MKILIYKGDYDLVKQSGVGQAIEHQELSFFFPVSSGEKRALCDHRHGSCGRGLSIIL